MIQWRLAIWSLVLLPFLKSAWKSGSSHIVEAWLGEFWALLCQHVRWLQLWGSLSILWHCLSLGLEWKGIKRLLLIKTKTHRYLKEFSSFLCMKRCKSLGSLKSFFFCGSQLYGARILFSYPSHLRCTIRGGCRGWFLGGVGCRQSVCLHPVLPQDSPSRRM